MSPASANPPARHDPASSAATRTHALRRSRLLRQIALFAFASVAIILVALANRDRENIRHCFGRVDFVRAQLQIGYERGRGLPPNLPMLGEIETDAESYIRDPLRRRPGSREHYAYFGATNLNLPTPVVVCACFRDHRLYMRDDGRHVIIFDPTTHKFVARWMTADEFAKNAKEMGVGELLDTAK